MTINTNSPLTEGRPCDIQELLRQIGRMNVLAISGGRVYAIANADNDNVGVRLPVTAARVVDVVLDYNDTYIVRRVRIGRNAEVVEHEETFVYCDQVGEAAYQASCWK